MNFSTKQVAAELLKRRTASPDTQRLDEAMRPLNTEQALSVQFEMIDLHTDHVGGWKCLLPLSNDKLVLAPIFSNTIQHGEVCELFKDRGAARIEPEIAFILGKALPANSDGYSEQQINDAIGSCHMALELMQSRFSEESGAEFHEKLADGLMNQGLFIGPEIQREKAFSAGNIDISIVQGDNQQQFVGLHPNTLAQTPIYWFINYMTRRGIHFKAGEAIITGSYCGIVNVGFSVPTTISYADIGEYSVEFREKTPQS